MSELSLTYLWAEFRGPTTFQIAFRHWRFLGEILICLQEAVMVSPAKYS
jgi:hypothetical protein